MAIQILDGKGRGYSVGVDVENRLLTRTASKTEAAFTALVNGKAYFFPTNFITYELELQAEEAGVLYLQYTGNKRFVIDNARFSSDFTSRFRMYLSPTSITNTSTGSSVNTNATSGNSFTGSFLVGGSNSVVTGGNLCQQIIIGGESNGVMQLQGSVVLGQNDSIAITIQSDIGSGVSILAGCTLTGYEASVTE